MPYLCENLRKKKRCSYTGKEEIKNCLKSSIIVPMNTKMSGSCLHAQTVSTEPFVRGLRPVLSVRASSPFRPILVVGYKVKTALVVGLRFPPL